MDTSVDPLLTRGRCLTLLSKAKLICLVVLRLKGGGGGKE